MLNNVKMQITEMLETLQTAIPQMMEGSMDANDVYAFIESINKTVGVESPACAAAGNELIHALSTAPETAEDAFVALVDAFQAIPTQYKVLFLPYFESTWDAMESVWEAFANDEQFITQITIIPINRNMSAGQSTVIYKDFLTEIGIAQVPYEKYDIATDNPDIVFICEPYDATIVPQFTTPVLRKHAKLLVYIPYMLPIHVSNDKNLLPASSKHYFSKISHDMVDVYCAPGPLFYNKFKDTLPNAKKMVSLGSPKYDYINKRKNEKSFPKYPKWEAKIKGRTVFFLNTHFSSFGDPNWKCNPNAWINYLMARVSMSSDLALIWRPHPLALSQAEKDPNIYEMQDFFNRVRKGEFPAVILDETDNALSAISYCHGALTESSSILATLAYLDVPTLSLSVSYDAWMKDTSNYYKPAYNKTLAKSKLLENEPYPTIFYSFPSCGLERHLHENENIDKMMYHRPIEAFIQAIKAGQDPLADRRRAWVDANVINKDGNAGKTIHNYIVENYL
ncbi:MAG: hypothetical protein FWC16_05760 [Defluviitaleaceae bacterium]|nr:hypothetical protein [Defluviitaleaceae bacterium]MCL2274413.1 hypothetical protein [Defluviitaleaceae bacterium]